MVLEVLLHWVRVVQFLEEGLSLGLPSLDMAYTQDQAYPAYSLGNQSGGNSQVEGGNSQEGMALVGIPSVGNSSFP